jgi:hypothetical protein
MVCDDLIVPAELGPFALIQRLEMRDLERRAPDPPRLLLQRLSTGTGQSIHRLGKRLFWQQLFIPARLDE